MSDRLAHFTSSLRACAQLGQLGPAPALFVSPDGPAPAPTLLDLYCGVGAVGLYLSHTTPHIERLVGIEIAAEAIRCAERNAALNDVAGEWHAGPVEDVLPGLTLDANCDVIVDPPRVGLHPRALRFLATFPARRLIYVACNPASLARDREGLEAGGWKLREIRSVDLFPQTQHLEAIGRFER